MQCTAAQRTRGQEWMTTAFLRLCASTHGAGPAEGRERVLLGQLGCRLKCNTNNFLPFLLDTFVYSPFLHAAAKCAKMSTYPCFLNVAEVMASSKLRMTISGFHLTAADGHRTV